MYNRFRKSNFSVCPFVYYRKDAFAAFTYMQKKTSIAFRSNRMNLRSALLTVLLFTANSLCDITGVVFDSFTKKPIPGCVVEVSGTELSQKTDENGAFHFEIKIEGSYNLIFRHENYVLYKRSDVYVSGRKTEPLHIDLDPAIHSLQSISVTAKVVDKNPEMVTSTGTFLNSELLRAPGALADVQRIVQNLPGVVSGADNVNEVIVRGGMRNENLFLIDNIEVINPNHFAEENSGGGVLSLLNPLLVRKLVFSAGAPPALYGGKASSVIDVTLREGNDEQVFAGADLGVTGAGFHIEGPAWPGSNFIFSANKSYLDLVSKFEPGTAVPKYWAAQGKLKQSLKNSTVSLLSMFGDSYIEIENGKETHGLSADVINSGSKNFLSGINWERKFNDRVHSLMTISAVNNKFRNFGYNTTSDRDMVFSNETAVREYTLKLESELFLNDFIKIKSGLFGKRAEIDIERKNRDDTLFFYENDQKWPLKDSAGNTIHTAAFRSGSIRSETGGGFLSSSLFFDSGIRLVTGVRGGYFRYTGEAVVDPRVGISYVLNDMLTFNSSFGIQNQFPDNSDLILNSKGRSLKAKRAVTGVFGVDCSPGIAGINIVVESFYKRYNNLSLDYLYDFSDQQFYFLRGYRRSGEGEGKSYGIEFFSEKKLTDMFSFSLAYSHSRSYWKYVGSTNGEWFRGDYDYRNVLTFTGGYKFELAGKAWYDKLKRNLLVKLSSPILPFADRQEFSVRFSYRGGRPYTPFYYDASYKRWSYRPNELNTAQMDPYHRLDFRWERRYSYGLIKAIFYFEVQNLYNRKNIWTFLYDDQKDIPAKVYQLPVFPSGGFIIGF